MATKIWVSFGTGNGLLPKGLSPEPLSVDLSVVRLRDINLGAIPQQIPQLPITKLENLVIYFYSNLPRGNKLTTVRVQHKNSFIRSLPYILVQKYIYPDSKVHGANMGHTWVLSAPDGPHVGPMNLAIRVFFDLTWMKQLGRM